MSKKSVELIIIDPQNDFCDPKGALFVPGADEDVVRLATMIERCKKQISDIHVTLDQHHLFDIAHPLYWKNINNEPPAPFTIITVDDIESGKWLPSINSMKNNSLEYAKALEKGGRYPLCIWPPHCLIGSYGAAVNSILFTALLHWEEDYGMVDYVTKGSNYTTEHYSAVMAEVPDTEDPGTSLNIGLINTLQKADIIGISGEALSHCVANTVIDIANNFGEENIKKLVLLEDTTSSVTGFASEGNLFMDEMEGRGMKIQKSTEFLK
jgi:nicotinamidase-related amidase